MLAGILLAPMMAPVWGFRFLMERLQAEADSVMGDESRGFAELMALSMRRSAGKISEEEYAEQEASLLQRIAEMREYQETLLEDELEWDEDEVQQ